MYFSVSATLHLKKYEQKKPKIIWKANKGVKKGSIAREHGNIKKKPIWEIIYLKHTFLAVISPVIWMHSLPYIWLSGKALQYDIKYFLSIWQGLQMCLASLGINTYFKNKYFSNIKVNSVQNFIEYISLCGWNRKLNWEMQPETSDK